MTDNHLTLDRLQEGQRATVTRVHSRGLERRRLLDLGLLPGTAVHVEMGNPLGDPIAYQVRGAVVALRRAQTRHVEIVLNEGSHG